METGRIGIADLKYKAEKLKYDIALYLSNGNWLDSRRLAEINCIIVLLDLFFPLT